MVFGYVCYLPSSVLISVACSEMSGISSMSFRDGNFHFGDFHVTMKSYIFYRILTLLIFYLYHFMNHIHMSHFIADSLHNYIRMNCFPRIEDP